MNKRIFCILCCIMFVLSACGKKTDSISDKKEGVYFSKISEKNISYAYNPNALYAYSSLYYNGKIYCSVKIDGVLDKSELNLEKVLETEVATVSTNNNLYWSTDSSKLFEVTGKGKLYKVKGYNTDFRVAVYYELAHEHSDETSYTLIIFDCLNDITLNKGSDLFEERIYLKESVKLEAQKPYEEISDEITCFQLSMDNSVVNAFIDALCANKIVDPEDKLYPELNIETAYTLTFYDEINVTTNLLVYELGYVVIKTNGHEDIVVQVDMEICKDMLELINGL